MLIETEYLAIEADYIMAVHFREDTSRPVSYQGDNPTGYVKEAIVVTRTYQAVVPEVTGRIVLRKWKEYLATEDSEMPKRRRRSFASPAIVN